jgi:prepilin-type N-terminal cleavage/methylation domain-containing protein
MNISAFNFHASARQKFRRGFTLLEIMVAIGLFMMLIAAIYSTWALVTKAAVVGQKAATDAQRERVALRTIEDALMCAQSFQASQKYYSFIVENGDTATLSFAARVPDVFPRNGKFGDFNLRRVTFQLEAGADGLKNLVLRQNPILMDMDEDEKKFPIVLAKNVKTLLMECWDAQQLDWVTEWKDTNAIPAFIRLGLVLAAKPESHSPDLVVTRALAVPSQMMPANIQRGGGAPGGPGGPGGPALTPPPIKR